MDNCFGITWQKTNSAGDKTGGPGKYYFMNKELFQNQLPDGDVWMWREHLDLLNQPKNITDASTISEGNVNTTDPSGDTDHL